MDEEEIGLAAPEILGERQRGHRRPDDENADREAGEQPGEDAQRALGEEYEAASAVVSKLWVTR